ncbi:MAG: hypothetical protein Q9225_001006 [Loekoesia sp. 1 TL-2023]
MMCVAAGGVSGDVSSFYYSSVTAAASGTAFVRPTSNTVQTVTSTGSATTTVPYQSASATQGGSTAGMTATTSNNGLSGGAIAGIVIGVLAGIIVLLLICAVCCFRGLLDSVLAFFGLGPRRRRQETTYIEERHSHHTGRGGGGRWWGTSGPSRIDRPPRKESGGFGGVTAVAAGLGTLAVLLGLKRRRDRRDKESYGTASSYSYSDYTSQTRHLIGGRTTQPEDTQGDDLIFSHRKLSPNGKLEAGVGGTICEDMDQCAFRSASSCTWTIEIVVIISSLMAQSFRKKRNNEPFDHGMISNHVFDMKVDWYGKEVQKKYLSCPVADRQASYTNLQYPLHRPSHTKISISMPTLASRRLAASIPRVNRSLSLVRVHNPPILRPFGSTAPQRSGDAHSHYDPPSGWLWGIPPGEKREKEGWENVWIYGFFGGLLMGVVAYAYKPDTS